VDDTLRGKVAMVTGASSGMGKEIALALAGKAASVVMVCRDPARGEAARAEVQQKSGNSAVEF
jgi:NAD(P)-dependent dehydrogenase (short-subunit alcohol dehydrogenase family)